MNIQNKRHENCQLEEIQKNINKELRNTKQKMVNSKILILLLFQCLSQTDQRSQECMMLLQSQEPQLPHQIQLHPHLPLYSVAGRIIYHSSRLTNTLCTVWQIETQTILVGGAIQFSAPHTLTSVLFVVSRNITYSSRWSCTVLSSTHTPLCTVSGQKHTLFQWVELYSINLYPHSPLYSGVGWIVCQWNLWMIGVCITREG